MKYLLLLHALLLIPLCGCERSTLKTIPVTGTVKFLGNPLKGGTVSFHPADGNQGRPARGTIDENGNYVAATLQSAPGLVPGTYRVTVLHIERPIYEVAPSKASKVKFDIPARYTSPETSGLSLEVPAGSKAIEFPLELTE